MKVKAFSNALSVVKDSKLVIKASRTVNKVGFKVRKHSPEILVGAGVVGTVAASVMACRATIKAKDIVDELHDDMDKIHLVAEKEDPSRYSEEDLKKDTVIVYAQTAVKFAKLYGPAVLLGATSITSILAGHNILRKRNVALAAAYAGLDKSFKEYRSRVVERFGEKLDKELRYNIKAEEFEKIEKAEDGTEVVTKETVEVVDPNGFSIYARIYDDGNTGWSKNPEDSLYFLKCQQAYFNERLKRKGRVFLDEVYGALGFPVTKDSHVIGWLYDEKNPIGHNFIDFGIFDLSNKRTADFVNGYERAIVLDFNVDGNIWEMM